MKIILVFLLFTAYVLAAQINPKVFVELKKKSKADILIVMKDQVDFTPLKQKLNKMDWISRGRYVYKLLTEKAKETQEETRKFLKKNNVEFQNLWIQNTIHAKDVPKNVIFQLSTLKSVNTVNLDEEMEATWEKPDRFQPNNLKKNEKRPEPGLDWIKATDAWKAGYTGKGIVLATADSGTHWEHPALRSNYRGFSVSKIGVSVNHNFNWFDPVARSAQPVDNNGHGSHCQGSVTGAVHRKIGVAPDAKWISCRIADRRFVASNVILCWQFVLAPFDLNRQNANPDKRAHVCSHSYTCPICNLDASIKAHLAAGIFVVAAAGNAGPRCSTNGHPARVKEVLSVAALGTRSNVAARFSSRGPGLGGINKPDISAPGVSIVSAANSGTGYRSLSGTSMAAPHINGAIGLIWSAVPSLVGKIDETFELLKKTSLGQSSTECGSRGSPNNVYGYGTINVLKAINEAKKNYSNKN